MRVLCVSLKELLDGGAALDEDDLRARGHHIAHLTVSKPEDTLEPLGLVLLELDIEEGDFETVAGWALERLGHIPAAGETFEADGFTVAIIEMDNLKIETLRLTKNRQARTGGGEE